jgi:alkylated DNA repair dioxygenase AlkB
VIGDLFSKLGGLERLPIRDADVYFLHYLQLDQSSDEITERLIAEVPWRAEKVVVWGKTFLQPRLIAWYGEKGSSYTYSGISLDPLPWTSLLLGIKTKVETVVQATFNSALINYYRDNRDSMGFHSDDEPELGEQPIIASLSLGDERTFILKHKTKALKPVHLKLASNSLLVMKGETQKNWQHGIEKEKSFRKPRVNLTFRQIRAERHRNGEVRA